MPNPAHRGDAPTIQGYRLLRVLGDGGMSTVYLAEQASLGREVALKLMRPEALSDEVSRRRFENETRTIARLRHPNIVGIHDVGRSGDGLPWFTMPYLARGHLGQRDYTGNEDAVRHILRSLLDALEYAHGRGVVHRDVKPENVMFDDGDRPLLTDFGIAQRRGYGSRVTHAGFAVGSTAYMPPEQARGEAVDPRADLYSVGVLGWEKLTGRLPYVAGDALSMALQHVQKPIPRLPARYRHWQRFFDRALAKSPDKRFADARQMREALADVPQPATGLRSDVGDVFAAFRANFRPWRTLVALALVVALGFGAWQALGLWRANLDENVPTSTDAAAGLPAPDVPLGHGAIVGEDSEPLFRPLPESPAERWLFALDSQLRSGRVTSPRDDNAYDSLLAAWHADAAHPRLGVAGGKVVDALSAQAVDALRDGKLDRAKDAVDRADAIAARIAQPRTDDATRSLRRQLGSAFAGSVETALAARDEDGVQRLLAFAHGVRLPSSQLASISARIDAMPKVGDVLPGPFGGMEIVQRGDALIGIAQHPVSRDDYQRFAKATSRSPALCRERASLLRIVKPRDWQAPGFEQSPNDPVVCVSHADAIAYVQWLQKQTGERYRLPRGDELQGAPAGPGKRVSDWTEARGVVGTSWRGGDKNRPLDATRGYDDVGFRLVRDLTP
ncbi:protein kinase domain-containing protein [Pseudoluteimonas lycopersici]